MKGKVYILFFDAAMETPEDRKNYRLFLRALQGEGFTRLQRSVYMRYQDSSRPTEVQWRRISSFLPQTVKACMLTVTADVFGSMFTWNCGLPDIFRQDAVVFI